MTSAALPTLVLLAGGLATRLHPITESIPKSMVDINGKPFIDHQLRLLKKQGIESVVICVGYLSNQIIDYVGDGSGFGLRVKYSQDGEELLGTGGSIQNAAEFLDEDFFVMYGDSYLDIDLFKIWKFYQQSKLPALMTVIKNDNQWDRSNVIYRDNKILRYDKKNYSSEMEYIDYGCSIFNKVKFLNFAKQKQKFDLSEIQIKLVAENQLAGYEIFNRFYEVGSHAGISELQELLK